VKRAEFPLLARLSRKFLSVDATSCEAERVFSCLALTLEQLWCSLAPSKVEKMMFLRLSKRWTPEFKDLLVKKAARAAQQASNATDVAKMHANIAGAAAVAAVATTPPVAASLLPGAAAAAAATTTTTTMPVPVATAVVIDMTS
jgi:hAT family C-terminal dimerisation region